MKAELIHEHGAAKIRINGKTVSSVSFRSFWPREDITRDFARDGIRLMSVYPSGLLCSLNVPYSQFGEFWIGEGQYDWDVLRRQMDQFIRCAPEDYFSLILQLDTRDWFLKKYPECQNTFFHLPEGEAFEPWRQAAKQCIRDTLAFLDREYPEKIYAVYVCAGGTCEWYNRSIMDEDPVKERAFRRWAGDEGRRLPTARELSGGAHGLILDKNEQNVIDYWHFLADLTAQTVKEFAAEVKKYNPGLLVGCFNGYILAHEAHFGDSCQNGIIQRLFDCPDIDIIFSPASYMHRGLESVSNSQLPMASVRVHGKMYYHEIDNTAYPSNVNPYAQVLQQYAHRRHASIRESIMYARRESACVFAALGTYWWFDMFGGWYNDDELKAALAQIQQAQETLYARDIASNAQVAYLVDEESEMYLARNNMVHDQLGQRQMAPLGRVGCQVDYFAAQDILHPAFDREQYKLYIFADLVAPTEEMRRAVRELRAAGKSLLFLYAPGIVRGGEFKPEMMEELTGIRLKASREPFGYTYAVDGPYNDDGMGRVFGGRMDSVGTFVEGDEKEEYVFGRGLVSKKQQFIVKKREGGGFDAWIAQGTVPEFILRPLVKAAGCFQFVEDGTPVYTNSRMLALFCHEGGEKKVSVPWQGGRLREMYTGEAHEIHPGEQIPLHFEKDECKCFLYEGAEEE